jgi:hypothetical protein
LIIFQKYVQKIQASLKSKQNNGTLHEEISTFLIIPHPFLLRMRNVLGRICRENQNTYFMQKLLLKNRAFYEVMWKNIVQPGRLETIM